MSKIKNDSSSQQLRKGAVLSYATVAFNLLSGLLYTPWMVSSIGDSAYGLYTLTMSVINFFMIDLGFGEAVSRFLSKYYAEGRRDIANGFLGVICRAYLLLDTVILAILLVIYLNIGTIYANLGEGELETFRVLFAVAGLYGVVSFPFAPLNGVLVSNERFVALNGVKLAQKVITVILIVCALLVGAGVYALVAVNALVGLVSIAVRYAIVRKGTDARAVFEGWDPTLMRELLGFSLWLTVSQVCQRCIFAVMPSILALVSDSYEIAVFGLASSLEGYVWTVAYALNGMFMPKISRALADEGDPDALHRLMVRVGRIQLYIVGFIVVAFAACGDGFVDAWMGPGYPTLFVCSLMLVVPSLFEMPQMIAGTAIIASGDVKARAAVYAAMAVANVALGFALGGAFGAPGACLGVCVAYLIRTFGMDVIYSRRLGMRVGKFFLQTYSRWLVPAAIALAVGVITGLVVPLDGWVTVIVQVVIMAITYIFMLWNFAFNGYEKGLVSGLFKCRLRR